MPDDLLVKRKMVIVAAIACIPDGDLGVLQELYVKDAATGWVTMIPPVLREIEEPIDVEGAIAVVEDIDRAISGHGTKVLWRRGGPSWVSAAPACSGSR